MNRPIIFSTPMVQAIIAGRKTQTRRIIKPQPIDAIEIDGNIYEGGHRGYVKVDGHACWQKQFVNEFAPWIVGDVLWVRETFRKYHPVDEYGYTKFDKEIIEYAADNPPMIPEIDGDGWQMFNKDGTEKFIPWKPSIHMPFTAARIFLEITNIKVERLQDISEEDAIAEGIQYIVSDMCRGYRDYMLLGGDVLVSVVDNPIQSFYTLFQSIHGPEIIKVNPWLFAIEFKILSTTGKPEKL